MVNEKEQIIMWVTFPKGDEHSVNQIAKKMLLNLEYEHLKLMKESNIQILRESEFFEKVLFPEMYEMIQSDEFQEFIKRQEKKDD